MYTFPYNYYRSAYNPELDSALELIINSVLGEKNDEIFYSVLISMSPTFEEKEIIKSIREDELNHNKMFRKIYKDLTGMEIGGELKEEPEKPLSYLDGIRKALFGELQAVERYRKIMAALPQGSHCRDFMFEIISDELKHAAKYNFIFTMNAAGIIPVSKESIISGEMIRNTDVNVSNESSIEEMIKYIMPLVNAAIAEAKQGVCLEQLLKDYILTGVYLGRGDSQEEAHRRIQHWRKIVQLQARSESKRK